jgi:hypothetical protein
MKIFVLFVLLFSFDVEAEPQIRTAQHSLFLSCISVGGIVFEIHSLVTTVSEGNLAPSISKYYELNLYKRKTFKLTEHWRDVSSQLNIKIVDCKEYSSQKDYMSFKLN